MNQLGHLSIEEFLSEYWQKKPVLLRNALPDFQPPVDPEEIAGLSLEEDVESRIILENGPNHDWELLHGPFEESIFSELPAEKWTLLVQGVDQWIPEMADLLAEFRFIPSWRMDDLMVSFAPKGGSVGPHFDHYDVFLIQAMGQRKWQVGPKYNADSPRISETPLNILENMTVEEEWTLNPGDILYVPPQFAHNGVALNDCMTFSVGFRAPSHEDVLIEFTNHLADEMGEELRYSDPDLENASSDPALINAKAIERFKSIITQVMSDERALSEWIGQYMTECKYPDLHFPLEEALEWDELLPAIQESTRITVNEMSRLAYLHEDNGIKLFAGGKLVGVFEDESSIGLAQQIANHRHTAINDSLFHALKTESCQTLLLDLINENHLYLDDEQDEFETEDND